MEIGPKATVLGRRRTFVVAKLDLGGGNMKVSFVLLLMVMVGRGLLLPPRLLMET